MSVIRRLQSWPGQFGRSMSANGEDNVDNEIQDEKQAEDKTKSKRKKDKKDKKTDPARFQGAGINFKAKLIGIESVAEARGDKMCQDAMQNLKAIVKAAGEHKQRIIINVSLEGIKILDDKSGTIIHHHAVHKISFISRDATDGRAFGYVYGLGEGKHDFFGIKTEKPAEGLVLALRDLFQTVFEIKKREVEQQKQRQREEEERRREEETRSDTVSQGQNGSTSDESPAIKVEYLGNLVDLVDLESELSNLQQGIAQMNAFATSEDFFASGLDTPVSPAPGSATAPAFPVSFDSPATPPSAGFTATFPPVQNDPFVVSTSTLSQSSTNQNNLFSQDVFAPQPKPFADFHSLPGSGPTSGNASPQPPRAQSSFSGMPVAQDPFKNDPFFSAPPADTQSNQQPATDKYAAFSMLDTTDPSSSRGSSEWTSNFAAFGQQSSASSEWPGSTTGQPAVQPALQPVSISPAVPAAQSPTKTSDPFAALDSIGGNKPTLDKKDFFRNSPNPSLLQMSNTSQSEDFFGSSAVSDPFASAPFVHSGDKDIKDLDPFDTSSVLQPTQKGPFDTSQLMPKPFESPPIAKKKADGKESNDDEEEDKFDFNLPSPSAPPPPLPKQGTIDLSSVAPAPPPRPRPKLSKAQTIDIPDLPPPAIPPRPSSRPALNSSSRTTTISTWLDKVDISNESPLRTPSPLSRPQSASTSMAPQYSPKLGRYSRTPPPSNQTPPMMRHTPPLTRGMSTPSPSLSYASANRSPIPISRPRPRPRPRTPGSSSTGTPSTLEQLPESESFSRDSVVRHSDKLDDHLAAQRIANSKSLVRNQSEPAMVTPTEEFPTLPTKEVFGSDPSVGKQPVDTDQLSDVSSVDRQSYSSSFKDSFKLDPFANADKGPLEDPFALASPPDPFSNSFCGDKNELFQTKAVTCDNETDPFENDPFGSDPFGDGFGSCAVSTGSSEHTSEQLAAESVRPSSAGRPGSAGQSFSVDTKDTFPGSHGSPVIHSGKHSVSSAGGPPSPSLFNSKLSGSSTGASDQGFYSDTGRGATNTSRDSTQDSFSQDYVSINWGDTSGGTQTAASQESSVDPDPFSTDFVKNQPIMTKKTTVAQLKDESSPAHSRPSSVERPASASSIDPNEFFPARQGDPFAAADPISRRFGTPPAQFQPKPVFQWSHSSSPPVYGGSESPRPDWPAPVDPYMAAGQNGQSLVPSSEPMGHPAMGGMPPGMAMHNGAMGGPGMAGQYSQMYSGPMTPPSHMQQVPRAQAPPSIPPRQQPPVGNPFYTNQWPQ